MAAITATNPGGEVIALDSGGYGPVTITSSVSIIAPSGVYAGISVFSGNGVTVTTAPTDSVTLRGLTIQFQSGGGGRLVVSDVAISGFSSPGIYVAPTQPGNVAIERSTLTGNQAGVALSGQSAAITAVIDSVHSHRNSGYGIGAFDNANVTVRNSRLTSNGTGLFVRPLLAGSNTDVTLEPTEISHSTANGAFVGDAAGTSTLMLNNCTIVYNGTGVSTTDGALIRLVGTTISRNAVGIDYFTGGLAESQGNNFIDGNTSNGTAPTIVGAK
jgi:hypothetical protein